MDVSSTVCSADSPAILELKFQSAIICLFSKNEQWSFRTCNFLSGRVSGCVDVNAWVSFSRLVTDSSRRAAALSDDDISYPQILSSYGQSKLYLRTTSGQILSIHRVVISRKKVTFALQSAQIYPIINIRRERVSRNRWRGGNLLFSVSHGGLRSRKIQLRKVGNCSIFWRMVANDLHLVVAKMI